MDEVIDLTACIAQGKKIKIGRKEYEIKFDYKTLLSLEKQYGTVGAAIECFMDKQKIYENVLNFLYAACGEKYSLKKTDIEGWISLSTVNILYNVVFETIMLSFGTQNTEKQGEA